MLVIQGPRYVYYSFDQAKIALSSPPPSLRSFEYTYAHSNGHSYNTYPWCGKNWRDAKGFPNTFSRRSYMRDESEQRGRCADRTVNEGQASRNGKAQVTIAACYQTCSGSGYAAASLSPRGVVRDLFLIIAWVNLVCYAIRQILYIPARRRHLATEPEFKENWLLHGMSRTWKTWFSKSIIIVLDNYLYDNTEYTIITIYSVRPYV